MARKKSAAKKAREAAAREAKALETQNDVVAVEEELEKIDKIKKVESSESESESDSESENEDDFGELITDEVESGINSVLQAIKTGDTKKLLDPKVKFFEDPERAVENLHVEPKHKPIYLKDYHRMNLLSGNALNDEDDEDNEDYTTTVDGKQSFVSQQREERNQLLSEIKNAFGDENDNEEGEAEEDDFLKKKKTKKTSDDEDVSSKNKILSNVDGDEFLNEFVSNQAWIPQEGDKVIDLDTHNDSNDEEFENAVEKFENAYNFRYEDPNAAEIVSYARNQATLRRSDTSSRRRKRDEEKNLKETKKKEKEVAVQKKKIKKVNKLTDVLEQLKKEYGADIDESMVKRISDTLMKSDYSENDWDNVVTELFNEEFYNPKEKPTWDDDILNDGLYEGEEEGEDDDVEEKEEGEDYDVEEKEEEKEHKSKKSKKAKKQDAKKEKKKLVDMVDKAMEQNKLSIIDEVEKEQESRGRSRENNGELKFRYREVSPESFGLTAREIFAADDADLNEFIGLKKFAPYRAKELRNKDKRKVTKSRRIREWRKKVFNDENGPKVEEDEIRIPIEAPTNSKKSSKKRTHSHHHHNNNNKHSSNKKSKKE